VNFPGIDCRELRRRSTPKVTQEDLAGRVAAQHVSRNNALNQGGEPILMQSIKSHTLPEDAVPAIVTM
jgi:hypothetical protein